jgi:hypothetical protein
MSLRPLAFAAALLAAGPAFAACPDDAAMDAFARSILGNQAVQPLPGMESLADGFCASPCEHRSRVCPFLIEAVLIAHRPLR